MDQYISVNSLMGDHISVWPPQNIANMPRFWQVKIRGVGSYTDSLDSRDSRNLHLLQQHFRKLIHFGCDAWR